MFICERIKTRKGITSAEQKYIVDKDRKIIMHSNLLPSEQSIHAAIMWGLAFESNDQGNNYYIVKCLECSITGKHYTNVTKEPVYNNDHLPIYIQTTFLFSLGWSL